MNFHKRGNQDNMGFQIAPMIDVVFLLLCFFLTSQIFAEWETEIAITLPTAKTGDIQQRLPGEIIINVNQDGVAIINGKPHNREELAALLKKLAATFPGQAVLLRADKVTAYEHIINVLDLCRQADIWNISFATSMMEN